MSIAAQAPPAAGPVPVSRPKRPPPRWSLWGGLAAVALITWWSARQIGFTLTPLLTNLDRGSAIIVRFFDPNWSFIFQVWPRWLETLLIAVIAAVVGNGAALFVSLLASPVTSPNRLVYRAAKVLLSVVRSLPDIAYALLFVAAVSTGALAGILALTMFNIGVNAKLTSETIDAVDTGPVEAADASGANRLQRSWSAVVPQILPGYLSYSLYVFELNIRASVVIGVVGAGGIGTVIMFQLSRFHYENIGAIIFALFVIVFVLDRVSIWCRRRLV